jgi:hypothetical protein
MDVWYFAKYRGRKKTFQVKAAVFIRKDEEV